MKSEQPVTVNKDDIKTEMTSTPKVISGHVDTTPSVIRMKSVRKDIFNYIKAVLEEPRIFLPPKFVEPVVFTTTSTPKTVTSNTDQFAAPPPLQTFVRPISTFRISGQMMTPNQFVHPPPLSVPTTVSMVPIMTTLGQMIRPTVTFITAGPNQIIQQQQGAPFNRPIMPIFPNGSPWQGLPPQQLTIVPINPPAESNSSNPNDSFKLPGGATLVAVTDRNADQLLKPKHLEKPHVTITMGDRQEGAGTSIKVEHPQQYQPQQQQQLVQHQQMIQQPQHHVIQQQQQILQQQQPTLMMSQQSPHPNTLTAIMHTPTQQIPLTIPYPINVPSYQPRPSVVQPPPLTQLRPQIPDTSTHLSLRVKTRLTELNIPEPMFLDLVRMYTATRDEFISTLKKGYLAFFPFMLGAFWRERFSGISSAVTGRKLASLMDLYSEDRRKGKVSSPEYLTKVPSTFTVTEMLLKQLMLCHTETRNKLQTSLNMSLPNPVVYYEMCRRWPKVHPDIRMTTKQLISVHHMLSYEPGRDASPEVDCQLTEIWKMMDREVPLLLLKEAPKKEIKVEHADVDEEPIYDVTNVSMEQLQEWFLSTENLKTGKVIPNRPHYSISGSKWSRDELQDLMHYKDLCQSRLVEGRRRYNRTRFTLLDLLHRTWKRSHPRTSISKYHLGSRCVRQVRLAKKKRALKLSVRISAWRSTCEQFCRNEENTQVIDEVEEEKKRKKREEKEKLLSAKKIEAASNISPHSGFSGRLTSLSRHANLDVDNWKKDFNKDENVLAYIGAMQKTSTNNKGSHAITWTPEVIRDLMKARAEARRRKRAWEDWAVKKYGGVGIAYNIPNVKFTKVDDMFREEWIKLRPEMSNLSIWTLVSYARKFDNLKKQLIEANGGKVFKEPVKPSADPAKPSMVPVYFPNSSIAKYDLQVLAAIKDLPKEVKDLLSTRQLAKEKQLDVSGNGTAKFTLLHLWEESWNELNPKHNMSGLELQRLLYMYELNSLVRARLLPALLKQTELEHIPDLPFPQFDEVLSIKPRNFVFPENDEFEESSLICYQTRPERRGIKRKYFSSLERDILRPNHPTFEIPIVEGRPLFGDGAGSKLRWSAKGYNMLEKSPQDSPDMNFSHEEGNFFSKF